MNVQRVAWQFALIEIGIWAIRMEKEIMQFFFFLVLSFKSFDGWEKCDKSLGDKGKRIAFPA